MPDENDIVYNTYGLDLVALIRGLFERLFGSVGGEQVGAFFSELSVFWNIYSVIALLLSLLFLFGFIYAKIRYGQLTEVAKQQLLDAEAEWERIHGNTAATSGRWAEVEQHAASEEPNNWRLAIIEADIMLDEALKKAGYIGATIGDKLKSANPETFTTIRDAWDAHMIRNKIAHEGSDFVLTKRVAGEAIVKYERVLREFGAI